MGNLFGMFVHFGIYAELGYHEQVLARRGLAHDEYEGLAACFDPREFDADEWVSLAKETGMKYICFTAKHHDGFCMWDTETTDYSIMHTPFGRDMLGELAEACRRRGMHLSIYYSNPDWHHPNAYNPLSSHQWKSVSPELADTEVYRAYVKAQLRELLTKYGKIYSFFWDIPPQYEDLSMNELVRSLQPDILINDRGYGKGDFSTPERTVPSGMRFAAMTEACQSVGEQSWGYREGEDYFSVRYLTSSIDRVMAMGGSYLLNVGPMPNGRIGEEATRILRAVGDWYCRMEGVLEDHAADDGACRLASSDPCLVTLKGGMRYFHFHDGVRSSAVTFLACPGVPRRARLMNTGEELTVRYEHLPAQTDPETGRSRGPFVSITGIPTDAFAGEPVVLEVLF